MGTKLEDVAFVTQLIHTIAETHFTHPDPVARLYAAGMIINQSLFEFMKMLPRESDTICSNG